MRNETEGMFLVSIVSGSEIRVCDILCVLCMSLHMNCHKQEPVRRH